MQIVLSLFRSSGLFKVRAKSELEVARIVWKLGGATVRQVLESLPKDRGLDFKTVQTYLRRLEAKGYVRTRRQGRSKVYLLQEATKVAFSLGPRKSKPIQLFPRSCPG